MHLSENEGIDGKAFVVTGGLGFIGSALCLELVRRGARVVRAFDLRSTAPWVDHLLQNGVHCVKGDIINRKDVDKALRGVDCVFHLAAFGMSGKEMLQYGRVDDVNINGTCHVLEACHEHGVKRLVYASTSNVVFSGKEEIVNGNEHLPYVPLDSHVDPYSRSKSIAEQLVLKSNGRPSKGRKKDGGVLYTCAIRPGAIYGPGEERHLPRIISLAKLGLLPFKIGEGSVKSDWVYIDNLVLAFILASMGLLDDGGKQPIAAGQPYFISDGYPVNTFEFLRPLLKGLDYDMPTASLPVETALVVGRTCSLIYTLMYPWLNTRWLPQPLLLPAEVYKVGVTHYFNYLKAKQELGYIPVTSPEQGMAATISFFQDRKRKSLDGPTIYEWCFCVFGMLAVIGAAAFPVPVLRTACLMILRSMWGLRLLAIWATAMHIGEAVYAWRLAKRVDPQNSTAWFWQTFALGIFSLKFLLRRAKANK